MNTEQLNRLSTETLQRLQKEVETVLASRFDTSLKIGAIVTFEDKLGHTRTCTVEKFNIKTVSVVETGDSVNPGGRWRISRNMLKVVPRQRAAPLSIQTPYKPKTAGAAW